MARDRGPDFVCIGAQKAGTTWLYDNLRSHPGVWLPPEKEIHFFNLVCPHEELLGVEVPKHRRGVGKYSPLLRSPSVETARWLYRFHHDWMSTHWYYRLFDIAGPDRAAGDITPAYSTLDARGVGFARRVLKPGCKVVLILRNPIERIWSGIKMVYRWRGDEVPAQSLQLIRRDLDAPSNRLRSDYPRIIELWSRQFGDDLGLFMYDDLRIDPRTFLYAIERFVGIAEYADPRGLGERSNEDARQVSMPEAVRQLLVARYGDDIAALDRWLPGIARRWLA